MAMKNALPALKRRKSGIIPAFSNDEHLAFSNMIQQLVMDEFGRIMRWRPSESALRGGGAVHYGYNSPRMSNDLNFLVADSLMDRLNAGAKRALNRILPRLHSIAGGVGQANTSSQKAASRYTHENMLTIDIRWTHPERKGEVRVKTEFYPAPADVLATYKTTPVMVSTTLIQAAGQMPVLSSAPIGVFADKIQAIASREIPKWRDFFDLGYILSNAGELTTKSQAEKLKALEVASIIQGLPIEEVGGALIRRIERVKQILAEAQSKGTISAFEADMKNWFEAELYNAMLNSGMLRLYMDRAMEAIEQMKDLVLSANLKSRAGAISEEQSATA